MKVPSQVPAEPNPTSDSKRHLFLLGGVVLLALALRLAFLRFQPLWWDEGWSIYFASTDLRSMLELTSVDIHPPFYYLLLQLWTGLFGPGVFSVRLLSALIGTLTVPILYAAGRRQSSRDSGLLAALLLALSPFHIYYSQEVRMYGLVTLLCLLALYFTLRWKGPGGVRWFVWLGYVLSAAAALYTQYYAAFVLLALNLVVVVGWLYDRRRDNLPGRQLLLWLVAQVAVAILFLPWLWFAGGKLLTYVRFKVSVEGDPSLGLLAYLGRHLSAFDWGHAEGFLTQWWWFGLFPLVVLLTSLAFLYFRFRPETKDERPSLIRYAPASIVAVALLCGFIVNQVFPFNPPRSERLLLLALPAYLLLVANGLRLLWRHRRWLGGLVTSLFVLAALVSLFFLYTVPRYSDDDYRPAAARLQALASPSDVVINVHPWQLGYFRSYLPDARTRPALFLTPREVIPRERQLWADDPTLMALDLERLLDEHDRIWLADHRSMGRVLEKQIESYLAQHAYPVESEWYGENTVLSLSASGFPSGRPATSAQFADWLSLESAELTADPVEAGWGVVTTDLTWRLSERPGERYHIGLRLVDAAGRVWAQRDSTPTGGLQHFFDWPLDQLHLDRHGLLVPAGTPPGDYALTLRVYRSKDVAVLPVAFDGGSGGEVTLGTVHIVRPEVLPPVEALDYEQPLEVAFGDRLQLLGFTLHSPPDLLPGETVDVDLFWRALAAPGEDFYPRLQLLDTTGASVAELTENPVAGAYPTAWWQAGDLVRDPHSLPIPAAVPEGEYRLALSLTRTSDGALVPNESGDSSLELSIVNIQGREHNYWPTDPGFFQTDSLGPAVNLIGYDLREAVRAPGSPLEVTIHWQAVETPGQNYYAFVHLLDAEGTIVAQHDSLPGEGQYPTLGWLPGEYLTDTHLLNLPFDLPDGEYQLAVGLFAPDTSLRLGERIILDTPIPVQASGGCNCR